MSNLCFSLLIFVICFASSTSFNTTHKCSPQQTLALLLFKQNLSSINFSIDDPSEDSPCQDWLGSDYHPIMMNWNKNTDCCKWDGVTCNHLTGDVIGIDLSCGMLRGTIHPNTSLFHLPNLQKLNLAYNDFTDSQLPREIGTIPSSLTHLNLSRCLFTGEVSVEILFLPKLVSLDLSWNYGLQIQPDILKNLLQNTTHLRELLVAEVHIGWVLPTYFNISSSLKSLDLSQTGLKGKLPDNIFSLEYLESLDLSRNSRVTGPLPKVMTDQSSLISLHLSDTGLQGIIPDSIFNLPYLEELDLSKNDYLTGPFPKVNRSMNIPLKWLDLSFVNISGEIPNSIDHLQFLNHLGLSYTNLLGEIPKSIGNLKFLFFLDLSSTNIRGEIPDSIGNLKSLNFLDLSYCDLVGSLPKSIVNLRHLTTIRLSSNKLNGTLPSFLFTLPLLENVFLGGNMYSGGLPSELFKCQSLKKLSLRNNKFDGEINGGSTPPSFLQLTSLTYLDLSSNNFTGLWKLETLLSNLPNLEQLYISYSGLSIVNEGSTSYVNPKFQFLSLASCKLTVFPESLRAMKNLQRLDLSNNNIQGGIPDWAGEVGGDSLSYLDLSNNSITSLPQFQWDGIEYLFLQSNQIEGPFPPSICSMSNLYSLDMSNNRFGGVILSPCFANITSSVGVVNLGNNNFLGIIPNVSEDCGQLHGLILNGNQFQGEVPCSLSKCRSLQVIDLGNNQLNDTFPRWLGDLPMLQVLVLKSNKLHGPIETSSTIAHAFSRIQVLDLSHNGFVGHLPEKYFQSFNAMKGVVRKGPSPVYLTMGVGYYSIILVVKGHELAFSKISVFYTIVDLSNNKFEGEIPNVIGALTSLIVLNLSHNNLTGRIPYAMGNISEIESLDLSWNKLTGEIPQSLADLTFLGFLNLSQNHLVGRIPSGRQFNTFESSSFGENPELCGFPMSNKCGHPHEPQLEAEGDKESGFTWKVVMLGYACGTLLGLVMGYHMLSSGRPNWINAIADAGEHMIEKRLKTRCIFIGR